MIETAVNLDEKTSIIKEEVSVEEVRRAVASMKRGKAVDKDDSSIEIKTEAGEQAFQRFVKIILEAYMTETVPLDWQKPNIRKRKKRRCVATTGE